MRETSVFYQKYLMSKQWQLTRMLVFKRARWQCERRMSVGIRCTARAEHVHHLVYGNFGNENLDELLAVCIPCHNRLEEEKEEYRHIKGRTTYMRKVYGDQWHDLYDEAEADELFCDWLERQAA